MDVVTVRSKAAILLSLFLHSLLSRFCDTVLCVFYSIAIILMAERAGYFTLIECVSTFIMCYGSCINNCKIYGEDLAGKPY